MGFSQKMCLPALAAATIRSACVSVDEQIEHRVDRRVGQDLVSAGGDVGNAAAGGDLPRRPAVDIRDGQRASPPGRGRRGSGVDFADATGADDSHVQSLSSHLLGQ